MRKSITVIVVTLASIAFLTECSTNHKVVNSGSIIKRKYNKGYFFDIARGKNNLEKNQAVVPTSSTFNDKQASGVVLESKRQNITLLQNEDNDAILLMGKYDVVKNIEKPIEASKSSKRVMVFKSNSKTNLVNKKSTFSGISMSTPLGGGGNGKSIASLVLGILSILTCWLPYVGLIMGGIGIVLGILGLKQENARGLAIAGLVCSIVGTILGLWPVLFAATLLAL